MLSRSAVLLRAQPRLPSGIHNQRLSLVSLAQSSGHVKRAAVFGVAVGGSAFLVRATDR